MSPGTDSAQGLAELARRQEGVVRRDQLRELDVTQGFLRAQLDARRWTSWGSRVVVLHNFRPTRRQLMRIAVLDAGPASAVCSHTALELAGLRPFAEEARSIHLLVPRGTRRTTFPGVQVHESRRVREHEHEDRAGIPRTPVARSAVDAAAWRPWPRFAATMLAAVVRQQLCTPTELDQALRVVGRVRHKAQMRAALADIAGGSQALSELDVLGLCRRFLLQPPDRRQVRIDAAGRVRYLDCEWDLPGGEIVVLEVDGQHHLRVEHWQADMRRERGVVISGRRVLRATAIEVRSEPHAVASDLVAIEVPRVVRR